MSPWSDRFGQFSRVKSGMQPLQNLYQPSSLYVCIRIPIPFLSLGEPLIIYPYWTQFTLKLTSSRLVSPGKLTSKLTIYGCKLKIWYQIILNFNSKTFLINLLFSKNHRNFTEKKMNTWKLETSHFHSYLLSSINSFKWIINHLPKFIRSG